MTVADVLEEKPKKKAAKRKAQDEDAISNESVKKKTKKGAQYLRLKVMGANGKQEWMNCWGWNGEDQVAPYTVCVGIVSSNHYGKSTKWTKMRIFLG